MRKPGFLSLVPHTARRMRFSALVLSRISIGGFIGRFARLSD
jgi:hypothetical protein